MKLFRTPNSRLSDDQFIAKLRRTIEQWDRWRVGLVLANIGLLAALIWAFSNLVPLLMGVAQPANAPVAVLGFITGAILGLVFGSMTTGIIRSLVAALGGFRAERLLIEFYDAQNPVPKEEGTAERTSDFRDLAQRVDPF